jgi:hypothetical protein
MAYLNANEGVLNTEIEILADALDQEPEEFEGYVGDEDDGTDLEQTEGWDGKPLGDEEQWETNVNGHTDSGIDRPIALREGQAYEDALRQRDEQIAVLRQQNTAQAMALDPDRQWRIEQQRVNEVTQMYENPEAYYDQTNAERAAMANRIHQLESDRVNASLRAAHEEHGTEFDKAYRQMTSMDPSHYAARALVQSVWNSPDPGAALMEMHYATGGQNMPRAVGGQHSAGHLPPSLNSGTRYGGSTSRSYGRSQRDSSGWPVGEGDRDIGGYSNEAVERDVFSSIWR